LVCASALPKPAETASTMAITQIAAQRRKADLPPLGLIGISYSRQNQHGLYTDVAGPHWERLRAAVEVKSR
jgi:hypothetical protein